MEQDFLDVTEAVDNNKPEVSERLRKLIAYAVVTSLDLHPSRESMAPVLVTLKAGSDNKTMGQDDSEYESFEELLNATAEFIAKEEIVDAYALTVDSADGLAGFPALDTQDPELAPYAQGNNMIVLIAQEKGSKPVLALQPYKKRLLRGGATPSCAPYITESAWSLL